MTTIVSVGGGPFARASTHLALRATAAAGLTPGANPVPLTVRYRFGGAAGDGGGWA